MTARTCAWGLGLGAWLLLSGTPSARLLSQSNAVVDEATFMVARKGTPIGRESFRIIRAAGPGGQVYRTQSTSSLGDLRLQSILATDSAGAPVTYELRLTQGREQLEFVQGRGRPGRFSVLVQTKGGEAGGEHPMRPGTVLLDDEVINQYYFVALAGLASADSTITVISPRAGAQRKYRLEFRGLEALTIGGQSLGGRKFALSDGTEIRAELWIDRAGRLLKASVLEKSLVAIRDDPPR